VGRRNRDTCNTDTVVHVDIINAVIRPLLRNTYKLEPRNKLPPGDYQWFPHFPDARYASCSLWTDFELKGFIYFERNPSIAQNTVPWTVDTLEAFRVTGQVTEKTWVPRHLCNKEQGPGRSSECSIV